MLPCSMPMFQVYCQFHSVPCFHVSYMFHVFMFHVSMFPCSPCFMLQFHVSCFISLIMFPCFMLMLMLPCFHVLYV
jgi:hypothetical protein